MPSGEGFANSHIGGSPKILPLRISCLIKSLDQVGSLLLDVSSQQLFPQRLYQGSACVGIHVSTMSTYDSDLKCIKIPVANVLYNLLLCATCIHHVQSSLQPLGTTVLIFILYTMKRSSEWLSHLPKAIQPLRTGTRA